MGIDLLDVFFRIERVFQIKVDRTKFFTECATVETGRRGKDIRFADFVTWVESQIKDQNPLYDGNVFEAMRREISVCLSVDESKVTAEALLVRDLGME